VAFYWNMGKQRSDLQPAIAGCGEQMVVGGHDTHTPAPAILYAVEALAAMASRKGSNCLAYCRHWSTPRVWMD
jgi:hypothetical protein